MPKALFVVLQPSEKAKPLPDGLRKQYDVSAYFPDYDQTQFDFSNALLSPLGVVSISTDILSPHGGVMGQKEQPGLAICDMCCNALNRWKKGGKKAAKSSGKPRLFIANGNYIGFIPDPSHPSFICLQ